MRLRVLLIFGVVVVSLAAAALLAWRAGITNGVQMQVQAVAEEAKRDGRVLVRLHAHIENPRELSRSHACDFSISIENATQFDLLAAHISLRTRVLELPEVDAGHTADIPIWTIAIPQEQSTCLQKAHWFEKTIREAKTSTCAMKGSSESQCRRLIMLIGDFDYTGLHTDDWEAAAAARAAADALRASNLAVGTIAAVPPDSFFKLGFDRNDVQKSEQARALASADEPFDPSNPADTNRLNMWRPYATMDGPVTVLQIHLDNEQVADWYKVSLWANLSDTPRYEVIAWVPREDLDTARAKFLAARTPVRESRIPKVAKPADQLENAAPESAP